MSDQEIAVVIEDLTGDAELWDSTAGKLETAVTTGNEQELSDEVFFMAGLCVAVGYRKLSGDLLRRMSHGMDQLQGIASHLNKAADEYCAMEQAMIDAINSMTSQFAG